MDRAEWKAVGTLAGALLAAGATKLERKNRGIKGSKWDYPMAIFGGAILGFFFAPPEGFRAPTSTPLLSQVDTAKAISGLMSLYR
jgi:hypothetical protein